ncbi:MAG: DUF3750 domain-containing protein [Planctomycetes bacterium]|nr:DUF3750 domain-containing protein [Planctomycetota bacterium]
MSAAQRLLRPERPRRRATAGLAATVLLVAQGCAAPRPSQLPSDEPYLVVVKSARLTERFPWITRFAHHAWIDVKRGDEASWQRIEVRGRGRGVVVRDIAAEDARNDRWFGGRPVHQLEVIDGDAARRIAEQIGPLAAAQDARYEEDYLLWPGPNSNTFIAELADELPDLAFVLDGNAVGKDWPGWIDGGLTTSKTGLHLDLPLVGAAVGARDGIELHLLGFTAALRFWPPCVVVPFLPRLPQGLFAEWGPADADESPAAPSSSSPDAPGPSRGGER